MLEKLFTSKNRVKILQFLIFEKEESYIREIARELKLSSNAVKREIDNLIGIGLIEKERNKLKLNKKSNILAELKSIFVKTDFIVYPLKMIFEKNKGVKFVLIFGSFAEGKAHTGSDIDLLVIGDLKLSEVYKMLKPVEDKIDREINPVVWTIENLWKQKNSGFVTDIFAKKIIIIRGDEDELRQIVK